MNMQAVGVVRGIFDLFVPGAFLILNVFIAIYAVLDVHAQEKLLALASNSTLSLLVVICLGYLAGVIVRLFGTEVPDDWSARFIRLIHKGCWREPRIKLGTRWNPKTDADKHKFELWVVERFPYVGWLGYTHTFGLQTRGGKGPDPIVEFHQQVWAIPREKWQSKTFFDFCKTTINSKDERAAAEFYSAEALCRYLTGMFYSLGITVLLSFLLAIVGLIQSALGYPHINWVPFGAMSLLYLLPLLGILRHYRRLRIKEAGIVFSATYYHRALFMPPKSQAPVSWRGHLRRLFRP